MTVADPEPPHHPAGAGDTAPIVIDDGWSALRLADGRAGIREPQDEAARWQGLNPAGNTMTISTSRAKIATAAYDTGTHALVVTTEPLTGPAFAGKTLTLHLGFDRCVADFEAGCGDVNGYIGMPFGVNNPSTLDVQ